MAEAAGNPALILCWAALKSGLAPLNLGEQREMGPGNGGGEDDPGNRFESHEPKADLREHKLFT